jgi:23S rRNA maturation mini-RNase III
VNLNLIRKNVTPMQLAAYSEKERNIYKTVIIILIIIMFTKKESEISKRDQNNNKNTESKGSAEVIM